MLSNMFLIQSLDLMVGIAEALRNNDENAKFEAESSAARTEFQREYVTTNGRLVSNTQGAYALAVCLNLLTLLRRTVRSLRTRVVITVEAAA
jgi:alpha-L-rhamnosidase